MAPRATGWLAMVRYWLCVALVACGRGGQADDPCRIDWVAIVPPRQIVANVMLGGLSDLALVNDSTAEQLNFLAITDRGPNATVDVGGGKKMRTIRSPGYAPTLVSLSVMPQQMNRPAAAAVTHTLPLTGRSGKLFSGRPNGVGRDEPILDATGAKQLPFDPNGVDTEGIVQMRDGTFWMVEEYRPSLLHVSAAGRVLARFVPEGSRLEGADTEIHDVLPAAYGTRRDNRGFESLAVSPDGSRLWAMLQSPLENGKAERVNKAGNVRLLVFDPAAGRPVAEHVYRLGDPADSDYLKKGAAPDDGKICAIAALNATTLLVIEQDDDGAARLYTIGLAHATDTLPRAAADASKSRSLEEVRDLPEAGIVPVEKILVADLTALVPAMRRDVAGGAKLPRDVPLKLEGMAVVDASHVILVNDNDFGVHVPPGMECRTCLWLISLGRELPVVPR